MMHTDTRQQLLELCQSEIGHVLTLAEAALPPRQFTAYKRLVLEHFHRSFRPQLYRLFEISDGVGPKGQHSGNLSKEGGCP